jgi:transcription antitermination factor NusG
MFRHTVNAEQDLRSIFLNSDIPAWFALKVRSRQERITAKALSGKGFEVFLPLFRCKRRWSDRIKQVDLPLFSTYLFCRFHLQEQISVLSTPGIVQIVSRGKRPEPVEETEISRIRKMIHSGLALEPWRALVIGQAVRLEDGPLKGMTGTLIQVRGSDRLIVSVPLLQRSVAVEIDRQWACPLAPERKISNAYFSAAPSRAAVYEGAAGKSAENGFSRFISGQWA